MFEALKSRVIGQDEALMTVSRVIEAARTGLKDARGPVGVFLFLGPTGVGKTELARALAETTFGSESAMLALDMTEFQEESSVNRLTGWAPGYGEEKGQLTEWVKQNPHSVIVFEEIEAGTDRIQRLMFQVMEEGHLTDGRGNQVDFRETVIIFTSNIGAMHLAVPVLTKEIKETVMEYVRAYTRFYPELLDRFDEIVMLHALSDDDLSKIMRLMLKREAQTLIEQKGIAFTINETAIEWLLKQNNEPQYGAYPLRRPIRRYLREPLADFIINFNPPSGTEIKIDRTTEKKDGGLKFSAVINGQDVAVES